MLQPETANLALEEIDQARALIYVEDKRPLCQLSSKRLEDIWHNGLFCPLQNSDYLGLDSR